MKNLTKVIFSLASLVISCQNAYAENFVITGNAQLIMENGAEKPATNIMGVSLTKNNKPLVLAKDVEVSPDGTLLITLDSNEVKRGDKLKLKIDSDGWAIYTPYKGEFHVPIDIKETIEIKLVANKSQVNVGQYTATFASTDVYIVEGVDNYFVQVFATESFEKALRVRDTLTEMGLYNATVVTAHYKKPNKGVTTYYKIVLGPYADEKLAQQVMIDVRENQEKPNMFHDSFTIPWLK